MPKATVAFGGNLVDYSTGAWKAAGYSGELGSLIGLGSPIYSAYLPTVE